MNRQVGLVLFTLALAGLYVVFFTDLFKSKKPIQIYAQVRPLFPTRHNHRNASDTTSADSLPVTFTLDDDYKLTEVKVVEAEDYKTNKYPHPLWHLISDSSSSPTKGLVYGMNVKGMKPSIPKAKAAALQTNTTYLLLIDAGKFKGEVNFKTREAIKRT